MELRSNANLGVSEWCDTLWISAFNPSKVHTHTVNTHPEQWGGVRCLAQGHLSRGIEDEESSVDSLPPPTIPAGPRLELATFLLRVQLSNH